LEFQLSIMIMSGVEDGALMQYDAAQGDGEVVANAWKVSIGRRDESDICLRNDTYISRSHAFLHRNHEGWWLEDCDSTNGTFLENLDDFFADHVVKGKIKIAEGQLFRVGRTWLRIQLVE
jgi:hypothetical protein